MGSTPLDSRDVADRVHSAAIHLLRRVRRVDEESGITAARLSALSVLVFGGPTTLGALARAEQVSAPTMSRLVTALERDGLAVRGRHADDGRAVVVTASPKGRAILLRGLESAGLRFTPPQGAYYVMADARDLGWRDDRAFVEFLARRAGVIAVPGSSFYATGGGRTRARFNFVKKEATLRRAAERLGNSKLSVLR